MRLRKPQRAPAVHINIAPLIDVVFLLIIFSMTITQFKRSEYEKLDLPRATQGLDAPTTDARLTINILSDGRLVADGQAHTLEAINQLLALSAKQHGPSSMEVLLRGDRRVEWKAVRQVMSACAGHGIGRVRLAVAEAESSTNP